MNIFIYIILIIIILILLLKLIFLKKTIKEINNSLNKIIEINTNNLITTSSNNKQIKEIANNFNMELKKLRKQRLQYENGNIELKKTITNISHDLRTPLTAIRGYIDLFDRNSLKEEEKEYLEIIDKKTNDLTYLTEQLFDFSKSFENYDKLNKKDICINNILENVICDYYNLFKENKLEPEIKITNEKIIKFVDENMIKRIFENIILNAIKHGEGNIKIILKDDGFIEISNKAKNLDKVSIEKIFDRYYTVQNSKKSNGLGLSIANKLIKLNGGEITAKYNDDILTIIIKI